MALRLRDVESSLSSLRTAFPSPRVELEQYPTSAPLAARMLWTAETSFGDVAGRVVADLGCGTGILALGASLVGARSVVGFDVDEDAVERARENAEEVDEDVEFVVVDVLSLAHSTHQTTKPFDTVVMNPPFGTRNAGVDAAFVRTGLALAPVVYSLHKSSTRAFFQKRAAEWGATVSVLAEIKFDIPKSYAFHKEKSKDVMVDLLRFEANAPVPSSTSSHEP